MAAGPPLRRAGCRHHAAQHDQLSRLAGASRLLAARGYRRQAEQMRAAKTDADSAICEFAT
jgi:hypothetical protein